MTDGFRTGYAALIGAPNAGKSTLLNAILGSKLAITSAKPQTTRNRIRGVFTDEHTQIVLVDTPGIHEAFTELNKVMVKGALAALAECDVVVWLGDMTRLAKRAEAGQEILDPTDEAIARELEGVAATGRVVVVANKMDVVPKPLVLPVIEAITRRLPVAAAVPISAMSGDGVPALLAEIRKLLPVQPALFPPDHWTEVSERFLVAEVIREKVFHLTEQEIPYSTFVEIERFDEEERDSRGLVRIYAKIVVERPSQKGIVIGKGGEMLKRIGTMARMEIQELLECRVHLEIFVKVEKDWTRSTRGLRRVGFEEDGG
jgi:GTP-binding protein Era